MSPSPSLAPPGSSTYNSATMHVGDGTWDSTRDDFLLPNLVGLNFATMKYNGMANRFFTMTGYHSLIEAHGILAAITFLLIVPAAIFLIRFYGRSPRNALRFHIWLQILTTLLATVIIALGINAVGIRRSLTNPHHGIGIAIYVLLWIQILWGCCVHRREKNRRRFHLPLSAMIHHWLGRAIALLGITQVALGLTLYGCDKYLFVLYTLWCVALLVLYFILEWLHERRRGELGSTGGSYYSDEVVEDGKNRRHTGLGKLAAAGVAGAGLASLWRRRSRTEARTDGPGAGSAASESYSYYTDEKSQRSHHGWGRRLLEIGAIGGAVAATKRLFDRRRQKDDSSDIGPVRPPLGGNQALTSDSASRLEEGLPPANVVGPGIQGSPGYVRPSHPLSNPPITPDRRDSATSYEYYSSDLSGSPSKNKKHHTFRDAVAAGGVLFAARELFKNRRQRKEVRREEDIRNQRLEEERLARMNSAHRYTADGVTPPHRSRNQGFPSQTASDLTGSVADGPSRIGQTLPAAGVGAAAASALADRDRIRPVGQDPIIATPGPPSTMPTNVPPVPPVHQTDPASSGSEMYTTGSGRTRHRHHLRDEAAAGLAGAALGAAAAEGVRNRHDSRNTDAVESPPVSLKMKVHNDGRHVTLRRLTEEEAAAQREARRASNGRRRRNSSFSGSSVGEALGASTGRRTASADRRWRRDQDAQAAGALPAATPSPPATYPAPPPPGAHSLGHTPPFAPPPVDPQTGQPYDVPGPPPPVPSGSTTGPAGSITSPGTDTSVPTTDYANSRRRRRAERARAQLAKEGKANESGNRVEFS